MNISFYYAKSKTVFWNIELSFAYLNKDDTWTSLEMLTDPIDEKTSLSELLSLVPFVHPMIQNFFGGSKSQEEFYSLINDNEFSLLINPTPTKKAISVGDIQYRSLQASTNVGEMIKDTQILDFPTFYIVKKYEVAKFIEKFPISKKKVISLNDSFN
jgi:hypothetical protein